MNVDLGLDKKFAENVDVHIHVAEGAVPKDGPSAGVTMATAMVSALTRIPVRKDVAMTGEITLRGRVLPIGGIKEKVLGAHRAGLRRVLLPRRNEADLDDIPADLRKEMQLVLIESIDEVLREALTPKLAVVSANGAGTASRARAASGAGAARAAKSARARPSPPRRQAAKPRRRRAG